MHFDSACLMGGGDWCCDIVEVELVERPVLLSRSFAASWCLKTNFVSNQFATYGPKMMDLQNIIGETLSFAMALSIYIYQFSE